MADAFPLQWPEGWKRTAVSARYRSPYSVTPSKAMEHMLDQLRKLRAKGAVVVSSNVRTSSTGHMRLDATAPEDPGVAVYWTDPKLGERVIACDRWRSPYENVRAIGLALAALRAIERAGATQILEQAFSAFGALPASTEVPNTRPWWEVMGLEEALVPHLSLPMVEARYRELAKDYHPDRGALGNADKLVELNHAVVEARNHFGVSSTDG